MNALNELIEECKLCGKTLEDIDYGWVGGEDKNQCIFSSDSIEIMKKFLQEKYSQYDNGYGCQLLFGEIVFKDRTWLERGEYDGSEWWEYKKCPERRLSKNEERIEEIDKQVDALLKERQNLCNKNTD